MSRCVISNKNGRGLWIWYVLDCRGRGGNLEKV